MKSTERPRTINRDIRKWLKEDLGKIRHEFKKALVERATQDVLAWEEISACFFLSSRCYSEMPICDHVWSGIQPPRGFEKVPFENGRVDIIGASANLILDSCPHHTYAASPEGFIICLTPGLFIGFNREDMLPGARLSWLKNLAPDLISLFPDDRGRQGIGVLFGHQEEITRRLGFLYTTQGQY
ncbi:MAG: hypothetical protein ABIB61_02240 [Candidatus Shapirobacteria bacterium]